MQISLKITLENPVIEVFYALQMGHGSKAITIKYQISSGENLVFELSVQARTNKNGLADFAGDFVQGKTGERFVYICSGKSAGQIGSIWERRLKIPLRISENLIEEITQNQNLILETSVQGTNHDLGPNCGTVKPFSGWSFRSC